MIRKGMTNERQLAFALSYNQCIQTLVKDMDKHREALLKEMVKADYKGEVEVFAEQAFLHNLSKFYYHYQALHEAVKETKRIINSDL